MLYLHTKLRGDTEDIDVFVVPKEHQIHALNGCHWKCGTSRSDTYFGLTVERDSDGPRCLGKAIIWCKGVNSVNCLREHKSKAPLQTIQATAPLELLHVNFTSMEKDIDPKKPTILQNVHVIMDHFTRFSMALHCPDQKANTIARSFMIGLYQFFGVLQQIHSD